MKNPSKKNIHSPPVVVPDNALLESSFLQLTHLKSYAKGKNKN